MIRSLIVAHPVRSFFSASHPRICLGTFSTVSPEINPEINFWQLLPKGVDFDLKAIMGSILLANSCRLLCEKATFSFNLLFLQRKGGRK
jgi:hypothetical protein